MASLRCTEQPEQYPTGLGLNQNAVDQEQKLNKNERKRLRRLERKRLRRIVAGKESSPGTSSQGCDDRKQNRGAGGRGGGRGGRHPPDLKGAEINMWYKEQKNQRKKKKKKNQQQQQQTIQLRVISMDSQQASNISQLLDEVKGQEQEAGPSTDNQVSSAWKVANCQLLEERVRDFYTSHLERAPHLDTFLMDELREKEDGNVQYQQMQHFRKQLPSYNIKEKLTELINNNQITVISGETGCGKTTQIPQFILDDYIARGQGSICRIVCTQPRRISAISVAERVAAERGEMCGQERSTGYQIRLEHKFPRRQGSILYCTTGILLKWMESDQLLQSVSHVILDEIHERDILSDFLLIVMKDILPKRPNLKLTLMSATLNANMFSEYFGNCPMIDIPGFTFPVTEYWIEDILRLIQYTPPPSAAQRGPKKQKKARKKGHRDDEIRKKEEFFDRFDDYIAAMANSYPEDVINSLATMDHDKFDLDLAAELVKYICLKKPQGAVLMFLPGWDQISRMHDLLMKEGMFCSSNYRIIPLHSLMPSVNQRQVFDRPPEGVRKIVLATNIAETSITIDDVVYVIDMGRVKETNFDLKRKLTTLKPQWVSKASALQRRGRAGRVQPGECYHVYSQLKADLMEEYQLPEMLRTPLESLCLRVKTLKLGLIEPFISKALQPPDPHAITLAVQTLHQLKALDASEDLTALGYHLSHLPVNPRVGKIILFGAMFCCLDPVLTIAASLDFKDPFVIPLGKEEMADRRRKELSEGSFSDHIMLVNAVRQWEDARVNPHMEDEFCWDNFLSKNTLEMLDNMKNQFCDLLYDVGFVNSRNCKHEAANRNADNHALIKAALCAGLYPNIAKVHPKPGLNKRTGRPRKPKISTFQDGSVNLHQKSVNAQLESNLPSRWLLYHTKIKSTSIFIHDVSPMDPYPLLFFGGDISLNNDDGQETICIDNYIRFQAPFETANLVKDLRSEMDKLLASKIEKPGATDWSSNSMEGRIMKAITDLLSREETRDDSGDRATPTGHGSNRAEPTAYGGHRTTSSGYGGNRSAFDEDGGHRTTSSGYGGNRSAFDEDGGHRATSSGHGSNRAEPTVYGGHRANSTGYGVERTTFTEDGGHRATSSGYDGNRATPSGYGFGRAAPFGHGGHWATSTGYVGKMVTSTEDGGHRATSSGYAGNRATPSGYEFDRVAPTGCGGNRAPSRYGFNTAAPTGHLGHRGTSTAFRGHRNNISGYDGHWDTPTDYDGHWDGPADYDRDWDTPADYGGRWDTLPDSGGNWDSPADYGSHWDISSRSQQREHYQQGRYRD